MAILLKAVYRFNAIRTIITMSFFHRNRKMNAKIQMEAQNTLNEQKEPCWKYDNT
jgi:hypothetical protein